jgi:hypothetical protein
MIASSRAATSEATATSYIGTSGTERSRCSRQKSFAPALFVKVACDSASLIPGRSLPPQIALVAPVRN